MSDYFLKKMYDDVKDPSWPDIEIYNDFLRLPKKIVNECLHEHSCAHRLDQLTDRNYWIQQSHVIMVYTNHDAAYLPIAKCASSSYIKIFCNDLGWTQSSLVDIDLNKTKVFALIINPMTRRLKGLVETLVLCYENDLETVLLQMQDSRFLNLLATISITDRHTVPYMAILKPWVDLIHWIPIDEYDADTEIRAFFQQQNLDITFDDSARIHTAGPLKQMIYDRLKRHLLQREPVAELGCLFAEDVDLYRKILKNYGKSR